MPLLPLQATTPDQEADAAGQQLEERWELGPGLEQGLAV